MIKTVITGATHGGTSEVTQQPLPTQQMTSSLFPTFLADSSTLQITQHKLNGTNYLDWSQPVLLVIHGKGCMGYITGDIRKPAETDPGYPKWEAENSIVTACFVGSSLFVSGQDDCL